MGYRIGRNSPKGLLQKAVVAEIRRLGYSVTGLPKSNKVVINVTEVVDTPYIGEVTAKGTDDYECTFLLSFISRENTPTNLDIARQNVIENINILIDGWVVQEDVFLFDSYVENIEIDTDTNTLYQRGEQRCRLILTKIL